MARTMRIRPALARTVLKLTRWKLVGSVPESGILVGAPHTSQWDWLVTVLMAWSNGVRPQVLIKHTYFKGPAGVILRATGGIPLDRENPGAAIRALLAEAEGSDAFLLAIAAEGTRGKGEYWKAGFYRISQQTGLPITLGFVDGPTRNLGMGPTFHPSGDLVADMDFVRAFYADKHGIKPENRTEPRLREEETGTV
ncbi:1-acyl-sn-glycerol-3-phosphate acyltransferase [Nocardioides marmoriginsengisoli]|nr:1-acyl-sn-glycerol-3-phosphate acyltransferase [Nocardioides marmoriginsengisoli]